VTCKKQGQQEDDAEGTSPGKPYRRLKAAVQVNTLRQPKCRAFQAAHHNSVDKVTLGSTNAPSNNTRPHPIRKRITDEKAIYFCSKAKLPARPDC